MRKTKAATRIPTDEGVVRRGLGALLGQATGDALGTTVEFKSESDIRRLYLLLPHNYHRHRGLKPRTRIGRWWALCGGLVSDGKDEAGTRSAGALASAVLEGRA